MCSLACETAASYAAGSVSLDCRPGASSGPATAAGARLSISASRSTCPLGPISDTVRRTWSNATTASASMNRISGIPASAELAAGVGTGSSWEIQS